MRIICCGTYWWHDGPAVGFCVRLQASRDGRSEAASLRAALNVHGLHSPVRGELSARTHACFGHIGGEGAEVQADCPR
jgi:hypothetical protein